jgi:hypothetical protein
MSAKKSRKKTSPTTTTKKKVCNDCMLEKAESFFFKVDSPLFPDGRINTCRDCLRKKINVDDVEQVIGFLRQIDKPFYQDEWEKALAGRDKKHPIGAYMQKLALQQYKGKTFNNSDGVNGVGKVDLSSINSPEFIETDTGKIIEYSDDLVNKWGIGYSKLEYLQMEKFFQDMKATHEIHTPTHIDMLTQLAYLSVDRNRLRQERDWNNYNKISKTYEDMMKSAGFRPVDRQGIDDATGIRTFSQISEEVEKKGFRKPPPPVFNEDIVDAMIVALANYYHRLVGKEILREIPEEIKKQLDEFYEDDLTPVELNDEEYEDLDFSLDEDEEGANE